MTFMKFKCKGIIQISSHKAKLIHITFYFIYYNFAVLKAFSDFDQVTAYNSWKIRANPQKSVLFQQFLITDLKYAPVCLCWSCKC